MIFAIGLGMFFLCCMASMVLGARAPEWMQLLGGSGILLGAALMVLSLCIAVAKWLP